jgi:signal transduction histidine kinase
LIGPLKNIQADIEAINSIDAISSILEVVCRTTGMGFAAIARVTEDKWVACAVRDEIQFGLTPGGELKLETTLCNEIRQHQNAVVIDHVAQNEIYAKHHTPALYGFQSYISMPITLKNGEFFGTLCAIDPKPAQLENTETVGMLRLFADLIAFHLNTIEQLAVSESRLLEEQKTSELRDQFIAILGHDLRNPVGAVLNVAQLLLRMPLDDRIKRLANILQDSSYRMKGLIENILDFARGRLGDGITLDFSTREPLQDLLGQVITELDVIWPNNVIEVELNITEQVICDGRRIAQLLSNLLGNALSHSKKATPVTVKVLTCQNEFVLSVTNFGKQIPSAVMDRLFEPFSRGEVEPNQQGLGLGLYISTQIALAHGGTLDVSSDKEQTCFTFRMPLQVEVSN